MSFNSKKLYFKALSLSLASVMTFSSAANATHLESTDNKVSSFSNIKEVASQKLKKCAKIGAAVGIPISIAIGLQTMLDGLDISDLKNKQEVDYHTSTSEYTKKQEGITWSWLACLQGIYKYHGVEISQKDIFKKIYRKKIYRLVPVPHLRVLRDKRFSVEDIGELRSCFTINDINSNLKYNETSVYLNLGHTLSSNEIDNLKSTILDYYNSTDKSMFAISDIIWSTALLSNIRHFVNIVEINPDSNKIVVEDPTTGLSYTDDLDNFCRKRYSRWSSDFIMFTVAPKNLKLPDANYYFVDSTGYTKHSR